jgi:FAD/FMN-containing dehydrogenase
LVDLSRMAKQTISDDKSTISVEPGARWGEVIEFLDQYGKSVIGGRIPHVGVGGLILAGMLTSFLHCFSED